VERFGLKPLCAAALFVVASTDALAGAAAPAEVGCSPVSADQIDARWNAFATRTGARANDVSDAYRCVTIDADRITACRTTPKNPAHPSIVIRTVVRQHGGWFVNTEAATAGSCAAFRAMLAEFDATTKAMGDAFVRAREEQARTHDDSMQKARERLHP